MISRTKIKNRIKKKTNPMLADTINLALKNKSWNNIASTLSISSRKQCAVNLSEINKQSKVGDTILIPGKILAQGEITKKIRLCALGISRAAKEKLKSSKSEFIQISQEIKKNPRAEGIKIIK